MTRTENASSCSGPNGEALETAEKKAHPMVMVNRDGELFKLPEATAEQLEAERREMEAQCAAMRAALAAMVDLFKTQDEPDDDRWDVLFERASAALASNVWRGWLSPEEVVRLAALADNVRFALGGVLYSDMPVSLAALLSAIDALHLRRAGP